MTASTTEAQLPTRARILAAALELFSERGYSGTSVGDVEAAAGLAPRSGALYKHFPSKTALLEAALAERLREIEDFNRRIDLIDLGDLRAELTLIGRWGLAELRREQGLSRLLMKEGDRVPGFSDRFLDAIVRPGLAIAKHVFERHGADTALEDPDATAEALVSSLVGFSLQQVMFGEGFTEVDDERLATAWVEMAMAVLQPAEGSSE